MKRASGCGRRVGLGTIPARGFHEAAGSNAAPAARNRRLEKRLLGGFIVAAIDTAADTAELSKKFRRPSRGQGPTAGSLGRPFPRRRGTIGWPCTARQHRPCGRKSGGPACPGAAARSLGAGSALPGPGRDQWPVGSDSLGRPTFPRRRDGIGWPCTVHQHRPYGGQGMESGATSQQTAGPQSGEPRGGRSAFEPQCRQRVGNVRKLLKCVT